MKKIIKYVTTDILRNKILLVYTALLLTLSLTIFNVEDNYAKGILSLLNIVLIIVPLVCIVFAAIYIYNSSEFIELLVSQPIRRKTIWLGLYCGLALSMGLAFFIGAGIPILLYSANTVGLLLLFSGLILTFVFVAVAALAAVTTKDKAKGIGKALLIWLYFSVLFDGLVLFLLFQFAEYPIEKAMIGVSMLNPIDLSRILILLNMDASAMMGYTGAVLKEYFGTTGGFFTSVVVLLLWFIVPAALSLRKFNHKDL